MSGADDGSRAAEHLDLDYAVYNLENEGKAGQDVCEENDSIPNNIAGHAWGDAGV